VHSGQGRRKLRKVGGGQALRGTFRKKRALNYFFFGDLPPPPASVYHFGGHKIFPEIPFFLNTKKIFRK
jgi:hypothetical protein